MKKIFTLFTSCAMASAVIAQPVIQNGNNVPAVGYTIPVTAAATSNPGSAGPNQTWDFSSLTYNTAGNLSIIQPSSSPIGASFPSANFAFSFVGTYSFFNVSSTKMEVQAYTITSPGTGNDYSPNPRTILKFPFNYLDSQADTWQKVGGSLENVTISYDAYGTLITNTTTYTNVIRIKEDYGSGDVDYQWYITNPLFPIAVWDHNNNVLYYFGATQLGIDENQNNFQVNVFPNPATNNFYIQCEDVMKYDNLQLTLTNSLGQAVKNIPMNQITTSIERGDLPSGIYFYTFKTENNILKTGKIILE